MMAASIRVFMALNKCTQCITRNSSFSQILMTNQLMIFKFKYPCRVYRETFFCGILLFLFCFLFETLGLVKYHNN